MQKNPTSHTILLSASLALSLLLLAWLSASPVTVLAAPAAQAPISPGTSGAGTGLFANNYCVSCHSTNDPRLEIALIWNGSIERQAINPCPASRTIYEELYYTERQMLSIDRLYAALPANTQNDKVYASAQALEQTYSRMLDTPLGIHNGMSLDAFVSEAQSLRYKLGKSYTQLNNLNDSLKTQRTVIVSIIITLLVLASLGWGYYNAHKAIQPLKMPATSASSSSIQRTRRFQTNFQSIGIVLLVLIIFSLPLFKQYTQEVASATILELERQDALDTASRLVTSTDRSLARVWALAQIGALWHPSNAQAGEQAVVDSIVAAEEAQRNAFAIWGKAQAAQEITIGDLSTQQQAGLVADELNAMRSRAWGLRLAADEWIKTDLTRARELLELAVANTNTSVGIYRDLDLRAIAVSYAVLDTQRSVELANQVADPTLRAWGLREIADATGQEILYTQATRAAELIQDPVQRARSLREIAILSGQTILFTEALHSLEQSSGAAQAYALAELAIASKNSAIIELIPAAFPAARTLALTNFAQFKQAWETSLQINDPYDRAHAQSFIATESKDPQLASQIEIPLLRDRTLRDITILTGNMSLAAEIHLVYYKVQILTRLGRYQTAWEHSADLKDYYPLVDLGIAWAGSDLDNARTLLDRLDREADKAQLLMAIAVFSQDQADFDRALSMALAARVRNDPLAPVRASLRLAQAFVTSNPANAQAAFEQAYQAALRIAVK